MSQLAPPSTVSDRTRAKKRMRTSEAAEELSKATRSQKYWFEDGTLILHVEDTLFRVHRGVLSRHSTQLDEILLPFEKSEIRNIFEGCNVVPLQGEKVDDWDRVLAMIYDLNLSAYRTNKTLCIETLGSMLRVGKKYRFDGIFDEAFQRIREVFPMKLEQWTGFPEKLSGGSIVALFKLMRIILETSNQTLLPSLFFCCSAYAKETSKIFRFFESTNLSEFDPSIAKRLAVGRDKIIVTCLHHYLGSLLKPIPTNEPTSNNRHICARLTCQHEKERFLRWAADRIQIYALMSGSELLESLDPNQKMCKECREDIFEAQDANRKVIWEKLPSFFGLPAWGDLQDL